MKLSIKGKLLTLVGVTILTYGLAVGYILSQFKQKLTADTQEIAISFLHRNANDTRAILNQDLGIARTMASTFAGLIKSSPQVREQIIEKVLTGILAQDKRYHSAWLSLEISAMDSSWQKSFGRKRYTFYSSGPPAIDSLNLTGDAAGSLYHRLKQSKKEEITEPYILSSTHVQADARDNTLGTSICAPLIDQGRFIGLTGTDVSLDIFQYITSIKPFENASTFLVSNEGIIVAHDNVRLMGKPISELLKDHSKEVEANIKKGKSISFATQNLGEGSESFVAFAPIVMGTSDYPWAIGTVVPMQSITENVNSILYKTLAISIVGLFILLGAVYFISNRITRPINQVKEILRDLSRGHVNRNHLLEAKSEDEMGEMVQSVNDLVNNLEEKVNFAVDIGAGKLDTQLQTLHEEDSLGKALLNMRDNLKRVKEEDEIRSWTSEGLTKMNEVLRFSTDDRNEYYAHIIQNLIHYIQANQGGMFLVEEDETTNEKYIELVAAYAYSRKKFLTKRINWGDSLIGQCILEGTYLQLKDVPKDYINITSGLGEAPPTVVIILPLKVETEVIGAIEIASFEEFSDHEIAFLEKVSESIASSIFAFRAADRTKVLLQKARENEEEMRAQEEEMRQNMEEMEATQETLTRQQAELQDNQLKLNYFINGTGDSILAFDRDYKIILMNDVLRRRYQQTDFKMDVGDNLIEKLGPEAEHWKPKYEKVLAGEKLEFSIKSRLKTENSIRHYTMDPVFDENQKVKYCLIRMRDIQGISADVFSNDEVLKETLAFRQLFETVFPLLTTDLNFKIKSANGALCEMMGVEENAINGKIVSEFFQVKNSLADIKTYVNKENYWQGAFAPKGLTLDEQRSNTIITAIKDTSKVAEGYLILFMNVNGNGKRH